MLSIEHQQRLIWAARPKRENFTMDNKELDDVIAAIRKEAPDKFHSSASVRERKFYDEPWFDPNSNYVRSRNHNIY
jgi:hypothetical protein